jgi:hypothetical protein
MDLDSDDEVMGKAHPSFNNGFPLCGDGLRSKHPAWKPAQFERCYKQSNDRYIPYGW